MNKLTLLIETYPDIDFLSADGFDDAIIGICDEKIVYSTSKCVDILINRDGMDYEEAAEFFDYNVRGAYVGEKTPIWVDDMFLNENGG